MRIALYPNIINERYVKGRQYLTLVARGSVSFALFPLVFILREAKRTSGGTRYKSHFHADVAVENLQNRFYISCDVFKLPGLSYYQNSSLQTVWQPCVKY
jgi:hypothetical protein